MTTLIQLSLITLLVPLPPTDKGDDIARLQGKWERTITENGETIVRIVKEHKGDRTTVTSCRDNGEVIQQHKSQFKLSKTADVDIFTYFKAEVTEGNQKGLKVDDEFRFAYRFVADRFYEFRGVIAGDASPPGIVIWSRCKED